MLFSALIDQSNLPLHKENYYGSNCQFLHREDLKYLQQFVDAYPSRVLIYIQLKNALDDLQFALTWFCQITHEDNEGPMVIDHDLFTFMVENKKRVRKISYHC